MLEFGAGNRRHKFSSLGALKKHISTSHDTAVAKSHPGGLTSKDDQATASKENIGRVFTAFFNDTIAEPETLRKARAVVKNAWIFPILYTGTTKDRPFGRYGWAYPTASCRSAEAQVIVEKWGNEAGAIRLAIYSDPGSAFYPKELREKGREKGVYSLNTLQITQERRIGIWKWLQLSEVSTLGTLTSWDSLTSQKVVTTSSIPLNVYGQRL
ncbi:hypothetical protein EKO27_g10214 [Xylaria grammica]|uniref:Uncharacterized protein n=1 Tax=Xylaria grammica TaxID=363999 RepID=A0A439CS07_9PEZI|nr:hypothetical protein EKO27_g10214 [Xylaria grammica]